MKEAFAQRCRDLGLNKEKDKIVVGLSGGGDSTCLLHLLAEIGFATAGAHLNHQMRAEAEADAEHCKRLCEHLDIPFLYGTADVPRMAKELKIGIEEAGRGARYEFLRRVKTGGGYDFIATAHTQDDLVETLMLNLMRGTGLDGLAGIPPIRQDIVRPLLGFTRAQTSSYCQDHSLVIVWDDGNDDESHNRVWVRKIVLPLLGERFHRVQQTMARTAEIVRTETEYLDSLAAAALERAYVPLNGSLEFLTEGMEAKFDRQTLCHFPAALRLRALRLAAATVGGSLDFEQTQVANQCCLKGGGSITSEGADVTLKFDEDSFAVSASSSVQPFREELLAPVSVESRDGGWILTASVDVAPTSQMRQSFEAWVEPGPLTFRSWQAGDKMEPLGFDHARNLSDLFGEAKLTRLARHLIPIVCDSTGPLWIPGVCLSNRVPRPGRSATHLEFRPLKQSEPCHNRNV